MRYRVLVVDDNEINLRLVSKILELEGCEVSVARNGAEAVRTVGECMPDLAILDVMMPDIDGYDLCRKLRQPPLDAKMPIVMLTAMNSETERRLALAAGADDIWSKPFDMDRFREGVGKLLASHHR